MAHDFSFHKSAYTDFDILYDHANGKPVRNPEEVARARKNIADCYGLSGNELSIITHLVHIRPGGLFNYQFLDIIEDSDISSILDVFDSLERKKFICRGRKPDGRSWIVLTEEAKKAFSGYKRFGSQQTTDFISMIRYAKPTNINTFEWLKHFNYEINTHKCSDFAKGWKSLMINKLDEGEIMTLCLAIQQFILHFTEPVVFNIFDEKPLTDSLLGGTNEEPYTTRKAIESLVQKGFLVPMDDGHIIAPKVADLLLHGNDEIVTYDGISKVAQIIKCCDIEKKQLFFSQESQEDIEHLHYVLSQKGFERACSILVRNKKKPAIQSLLWGSPGTGKTETVKQIALESGRDIFLFDVAKVTESEWGATEKLYRKLFFTYRYIVAVKSLTPILLINEADQVLSTRMDNIIQSIDKAENVVTNLLLQELEDMHGILLATTNKANILDEAFDRRFLFKTKLQKPDAKARKSIWKSMIKELSDAQAEYLADKYEMSGAQINNVATKRELAELYFLGDRGVSFIENLCNKEMCIEKANPLASPIGF